MSDDLLGARRAVLQECGAGGEVLEELLAYADNPYAGDIDGPVPSLPLSDEPHVERWLLYEEEAGEMGAFAALQGRFPQLRFPIREGMSAEDAYGRATRKGEFAAADGWPGLELERPEGVRLEVSPSMGGRIPVIVVEHRRDFVALVRAFSGRNEPVEVPDAQGACIVTGLNNWDRVHAHRRRWEEEQAGPVTEADWLEEFRRLVPRKELYQDRFIILSTGPYSAVTAGDAGLDEPEWRERSLAIRRDHESTHYLTHRLFGAMRNNLLDELVADFVGLVGAFGEYRAELARRFFGIESFPEYRPGGRLERYRGDPPLSDDAFLVLQRVAHRAVDNLDAAVREHAALLDDLDGLARVTLAQLALGLEGLTADDMSARLAARLE